MEPKSQEVARWSRIKEVLKEGQEIEVKLIDIDKQTGNLRLSRKALIPRPKKNPRKD